MLQAAPGYVIVKQETRQIGNLTVAASQDERSVKIGRVLSIGGLLPQFAGEEPKPRCEVNDLIAYSPLSGFAANDDSGEKILILPINGVLGVYNG